MPMLPDYFASHQWLRELRRGGVRNFVAVDFRVRASEPVYVGHYGRPHVVTTVGRTVRLLMNEADPRGWEFILPRAVEADEIVKVRPVSRVVGWRYQPGANGTKPCACDYCVRGLYGSRRMRDRLSPEEPRMTKPQLANALERAIAAGEEAGIEEAIGRLLGRRDRASRRRVEALRQHESAIVRRVVTGLLED